MGGDVAVHLVQLLVLDQIALSLPRAIAPGSGIWPRPKRRMFVGYLKGTLAALFEQRRLVVERRIGVHGEERSLNLQNLLRPAQAAHLLAIARSVQ
jgi:hypothetical protein